MAFQTRWTRQLSTHAVHLSEKVFEETDGKEASYPPLCLPHPFLPSSSSVHYLPVSAFAAPDICSCINMVLKNQVCLI
jgi:hypothetical protein